MFKIIGTIKHKNKIVAYDLMNSNGDVVRESKDNTIKLIQNNSVVNAKIQLYQNRYIVRLNDKDLKENHDRVVCGNIAVNYMDKQNKGTPLKVQVHGNVFFEQVIYIGKEEIQGREAYLFFNNQGVSGYFALSKQFIMNNKDVKFKFYDNEPVEVNKLLQAIKNYNI